MKFQILIAKYLIISVLVCLVFSTSFNSIKRIKNTSKSTSVTSVSTSTENQRKNEDEELNNFLIETLKNFKNRDILYEKKDPSGKFSDSNKMGIVYKSIEQSNYKSQFLNDIVIMYKTLYPENGHADSFFNKDNKGNEKENEKSPAMINMSLITSFKRIYFTMIDQGLYYSTEKNKVFSKDERKDENLWPYPIATSFCHGGRTIFLFNKENLGKDLTFPYYFFGKKNYLLDHRSTASHKMVYNKTKNSIQENKILAEAAVDYGKSLINSEYSPHFGVNIPLGGIGNVWPDEKTLIDTQGFGKKSVDEKSKDPLQAGHLYVRIDKLDGSEYASIMIGLEEEAPNFRGMYSKKVHNMMNALHSPTTSVCGGNKWKGLGEKYLDQKVPHNYGGKVVYIDDSSEFNLLDKIENFNENLAKKVWWIILSSNVKMYRKFKENYLSKLSEKDLEIKLDALVNMK